ncbi:Putative phospholipid/glycerol acyltransferase [Septoria linicola]|uniref:Phospholipid/glycerol acyltransferase n=1 Tax=Septoria linicola TaxID=215465 RepID=A0A9Q9EH48_9PEZI|nr:putative phospholipid/glycerol acyltransferase [Septoria linicola]USW51451.1 Putative phospholipid/glycerol acyltransferase [Septoria linicola]
MSGLKQRKAASQTTSSTIEESSAFEHDPDGIIPPLKHGVVMQTLRIIAFGIYFFLSCCGIHGAQMLGAPLYFIDRDWFYAWMALTKQFFGILCTSMTQFWSPTVVRISGDKSVAGLLKQDANGMVQTDFGDRAVLMTNHQLYTDWLYLWWTAYTNALPMHGHIYIILKDSLKWVPAIGPGMQLFGFIFMSRKWATDQQRLRYRLQKLKTRHSGPMAGQSGKAQLDPMWLLIFPEGTNLSADTRAQSKKFADNSGRDDMRHQVLPRSTGLQFCLQELEGSVEYLYDVTIGYEGVPPGRYGAEIFGLRSVYFQGRTPKSVNMHWRRFKISELPLEDKDAMYEWVIQRWREKDALLDVFMQTGKFPADKEAVTIEDGPQDSFKNPYINTSVQLRNPVEFLSIFGPVAAATMVGRVFVQILDRLFPS